MEFFADKVEIVQGSKKAINLYFVYEESGRPFPLTSVTEIEVSFPKATGVLTKKLSVADVSVVGVAELGQVLVTLQASETALLKICNRGNEGLSFSAKVTLPAGVQVFNFKNLLFVEAQAVVPEA